MSRFTFDPRSDTYPIWSPDGKWIMFASDREGNGGWNFYQKLASGAGADELTTNGQRFLLNVPVEQDTTPPAITVVVNWAAGLKK